jgi:hypothetical protein
MSLLLEAAHASEIKMVRASEKGVKYHGRSRDFCVKINPDIRTAKMLAAAML